MKDNKVALRLIFNEKSKRQIDTICALMGHESDLHSVAWALGMGEAISKRHAKGETRTHCLKPALGDLMDTHPEFFEALCEEGVLEWVRPLVMGKP